ncbi:MAG TPA: hypothetical protein VF592_11665 [Sphingomonas sp.]|jgi:hypothetical protein|uniref:hypothetical protein n=1 Tax=Sphingomonas sp. TaxID=28214 RepID=UPI002ED89951
MTDYRGDGPNRTDGVNTDHGARRVDVGPGTHTHTDHVVERKSGGIGRTLLILAAIAAIIAAILFATGFFRADVGGGRLPSVDVNVKGGAMPDVDVDSKDVDLVTENTVVEVPKLKVTEGADDKDGADNN